MADLNIDDQITAQIPGKVVDVFPTGEVLIEIPTGKPFKLIAGDSSIYVVVPVESLKKE